MTNIARAQQLIQQLAELGVADYILCSGSRNSPLVLQIEKTEGVSWVSHFEERAAGFWALGRCQRGVPCAVVVTSGTAVSELYSAVIEAHYQRKPLVVISADRPASYAETGAPQSLPQRELFGKFAQFYDYEAPVSLELVSGPIHINVPFDEPLIDEEIATIAVDGAATEPAVLTSENSVSPEGEQPLVLVGGLEPSEREFVKAQLNSYRGPLWVEAPSGLQNHWSHQISAGTQTLERLLGQVDHVIRIGDVPTCRFWRDLEKNALPVWNFTNKSWPGLARASQTHTLNALPVLKSDHQSWMGLDRETRQMMDLLTSRCPLSEGAWVKKISETLSSEAPIYLGNSMPIRQWDDWSRSQQWSDVRVNRGVNGIDGQLATFFGGLKSGARNTAILGDLTTLYDLSSLLLAPKSDWQLIILNNHGGQIFRRLYDAKILRNEHRREFHLLDKFFGVETRQITDPGEYEWFCGICEVIVEPTQDRWLDLELKKL